MPENGVPWTLSRFSVWAEVYFLKAGVSASVILTAIANLFPTGSVTVDFLLGFFFDKVEFEVVQFISKFAVNEIPSATIQIALGRDADTLAASAIHTRLKDMKLLLPIKVWMQATSPVGDPVPETWPADPFVVFDGYATNSNFKKSSQSADFTIFMTHWLADLAFSSSVTRATHPTSASQLSFWSSIPFGDPNAGGAGDRNMVGLTSASKFIDLEVIQRDFWGDPARNIPGPVPGRQGGGLSLFFQQLCGIDIMAFLPVKPAGLTEQLNPNTEALRALARFEPIATDNGYKWGAPLAMAVAQQGMPAIDAIGEIADAIAQHISFLTIDNMAGYTIWDKIMELSSEYMFAVVPMVDRALVVPFQPGLRGGYRRTIYSNEYDNLTTSSNMPRPLRGVCVYLGRSGAQAGADGSGDKAPADSYNGACWDVSATDPTFAKGMIMFKQAPRWLSSVVPIFATPKPDQPFANAIVPGWNLGDPVIAAVNAAAAAVKTPADVLQKINPALLRYAKATYAYEVLRGRQGAISGKLRFDIGPGSTVRLEGSEDPFLRNQDTAFDEISYATVVEVVTAINAETGGASTSFQLAFIRSEKENISDRTSVEVNPLWNGANSLWYGCPLLDNAAFGLPKREA